MTAVSFTVTDAAASAVSPQSRQVPGLVLYVGLGEGGAAELVDLARALARTVAEHAPGATTESAMTLGGRGALGDLVARVRSELATSGQSPFLGVVPSLPATASPRRRQVIVDADAREVTVDGTPVPFTFQEFALLEYLLRAPHRAVTREELLDNVWQGRARRDGTRTIDVHVRRLREKLGGSPRIVTVRGVGYRCDPTPEVVLVGSGDAD